jgi:hypothetical protein
VSQCDAGLFTPVMDETDGLDRLVDVLGGPLQRREVAGKAVLQIA